MARYNRAAIERVTTGFTVAFAAAGEKASVIYTDYCLQIDSQGSLEVIVIPESVGGLELWKGSRKRETPILWTQDLTNKPWEKTLEFDLDDFNDGKQLQLHTAQVEMLSLRAKQHPDELLTDAFINGFTDVSYDAVAFYSASHPLRDGTTQSNIESGALSATTFRSALSKLDSMVDYHSKPIRPRQLGGKTVLEVGPSNRATAKSIVALATSASGAGNPDYQEAEVVINDYLVGSRAAYWRVSRVGGVLRPFIFQMRMPAELVYQDDPKSDTVFKENKLLVGINGRWNLGYGFYQLSVGSTGA